MNTNPELDTAIQAVRTIIADTGYLPTLRDKRLDLFDLAWSHQDDDTARLENFAASRMADDPVTRSVIGHALSGKELDHAQTDCCQGGAPPG